MLMDAIILLKEDSLLSLYKELECIKFYVEQRLEHIQVVFCCISSLFFSKENKMVVASHVEVMFYLLVMDILLLIKIEASMAWQRHQISSIEALKADLTNHNNHSSLSYQLWSNSPAFYLQQKANNGDHGSMTFAYYVLLEVAEPAKVSFGIVLLSHSTSTDCIFGGESFNLNGLRSLAEREQSLDFLLHFICRVLP
ncbi:hypothetical protein Sjap_008912 [Stephania japonica]|uniref:Uncharacterized protein n=1 Tax=Stephania japonica TaxID=461633 RepID=A0AAP0JS02_9MAGN